jgi:hypothetical protein
VSPPDSSNLGLIGIVREKPRTNIYTVMLILSLLAISTACVLLWLELTSYGPFPWWKVPRF